MLSVSGYKPAAKIHSYLIQNKILQSFFLKKAMLIKS